MPFPHCVLQSTGSNKAEHSPDSGGLVKDNCCFLTHKPVQRLLLLRINFCFTKRKTPENCVICCCCVQLNDCNFCSCRAIQVCQEFAGGSRSDFGNRRSIAFQKNNDVIKTIWSDFFVFSLYKIGILYKRSTIYKIVGYYITTLFLMCLYSLGCPNEHIRKFFFFFFKLKSGEKFSLHSIEGERTESPLMIFHRQQSL